MVVPMLSGFVEGCLKWRWRILGMVLSLTLLLPLLSSSSSRDWSVSPSYNRSFLSLFFISGISAISPLLMDGLIDGIFYWEDSAFLTFRLTLKFSFLLYCLSPFLVPASQTATDYTTTVSLGHWQRFIQATIMLSMIRKFDRMKVFTTTRLILLTSVLYLALLLNQILTPQMELAQWLFISMIGVFLLALTSLYILWIACTAYQPHASYPTSIHYEDYLCSLLIFSALFTTSLWVIFTAIELANPRDTTILFGADLIQRFVVLYITVSCTKRFLRNRAKGYKRDSTFKTELVKYLSHEIRNPLNILAMSLEHVKLEVEKGNLTRDFILNTIASLESACFGAIEVLNELSTYEEIESENIMLKLEDCNPFAFLKKSLQSLHEITSSFGVQLRLDVTDHDRFILPYLLISIDHEKVGAVLRKIISKCIYEYQSQSGEVIDVSLTVAPLALSSREDPPPLSSLCFGYSRILPLESNDYISAVPHESVISAGHIRIEIPFTGDFSHVNKHLQGDMAELSREAHSDKDMLGLSIWISRKILVLHGGDMGLLRSDKGNSTIYIDLPYKRSDSSSLDEAYDSRVENPGENNHLTFDGVRRVVRRGSLRDSVAVTGRMKILVVDDSHLNRKVITRVLTSLGHECEEADDGVVAVEMMRTLRLHSFDAILME